MRSSIAASAAAAAILTGISAERGPVDWAFWGGDPGSAHYSTLTEINTANVSRMREAWAWKAGETPLAEYGTRPGMFENTPVVIDGVMYLSTPYNKVVALNPETGSEIWSYDPKSYIDGQPANGTGYVHRGVAVLARFAQWSGADFLEHALPADFAGREER